MVDNADYLHLNDLCFRQFQQALYNKVTVDSGVETSLKQTYSDSSELLSLSFSSNVLDCSQLWFLRMVLFSITDFQVGIGFLLRKMRLIF